jgi:hypothetical protein
MGRAEGLDQPQFARSLVDARVDNAVLPAEAVSRGASHASLVLQGRIRAAPNTCIHYTGGNLASRRGPDNTARIAIQGVRGVPPWANIFWVQLATSSSISQSDLDSWLTTFANQYKTSFAPRQDSATTYQLATATLFIPGGGVLQSTKAMSGTGTGGGAGIAENACSKVISWLSTVYWRGGKPRTYLGVPQTTEISGSTSLSAAEITALTTAAQGFRTAVNAIVQGTITSTVLGFVSFQTGNAPRVPPVFFAIAGAKVHPRLGTQRRRLGAWTV